MDPNDYDWPNSKHKPFIQKPKNKKSDADARPRKRSPSDSLRDYWHNEIWNYNYRDGWFWGGDNLARDLLQQSELKQFDSSREFHGIFLPMLYCFRHYLEVSLKFLIEDAHSITFESDRVALKDLQKDLQKKHGLMPLWNKAKLQLAAALGEPLDSSDDTYKQVERLINDFHQFDPNSQTFRYRKDTQGRPHEQRIPNGDLEQLIKTMQGLRNFFSGMTDVIDCAREHLADMSQDESY